MKVTFNDGIEHEIFKVQLSVRTSHATMQVLIYNKDESLRWGGVAGWDIRNKVEQAERSYLKKKAFFWGYWDRETGKIIIENEAPWQEW